MKTLLTTFLYLCLLRSTKSTLGYTKESLYDCNADLNYTEAQRSYILQLYPIDSYLFVIFGPISMFSSLFIILVFIYIPSARKTPGDILMGLSICDLFLSMHLMASGAYELIYDTSPNPEEAFCQANGLISTLVVSGDYLYNMAFIYSPLILVRSKLTDKESKIRYKFIKISSVMHIAIVCFMVLAMIISYFMDSINLNISGVCTIAPRIREGYQTFHYGYIIMILTYLITALVVMKEFKKMLSNSEIQDTIKEYLSIYRRFVIATVILWSLQLVLSVINYLNCYKLQIPILNISLTIFNLISILTPIIQCYQRLQDPYFITRIKKLSLYIYFFTKDQQKSDAIEISLRTINSSRTEQRTVSEPNILQKIQLSVRTTQIYTMLAGILLMHDSHEPTLLELISDNTQYQTQESNDESEPESGRELKYTSQKSNFEESKFSQESADKKAELFMDNKIVLDNFPGQHEHNVFPTKIISYSPCIFKYFLEKDQQMVDLGDSLNLFKNKKQIQSCSAPSGGKSGEFFFFSWDSKVIIKTMQMSEVIALRKRMLIYGNYLFNHPDSLISKIYGLYTLQRLNGDAVESTIHILIMRNISIGIPKKYIQRTFDMKGSEFDREVLNKKSISEISKVTLKDVDFFKTERKIFVKQELAEIMHNSLSEDAKFFKLGKLIDYSLLVMKVDWKSYCKDTGQSHKFIRGQITNPLYMVESTKERGIYYHIAIIDYLQEWNVNKSAEQVTKKIIKMNIKLDTSAQNPSVYSERFKTKLVDRILLLTEEDCQEISQEQSIELI